MTVNNNVLQAVFMVFTCCIYGFSPISFRILSQTDLYEKMTTLIYEYVADTHNFEWPFLLKFLSTKK